MRRLVIVATGYRKDPEAQKIFNERKWRPIIDESTIPSKKRQVSKKNHRTQLIDLEWEEWEYE